jgi:hypothetical protein
MKETFLLNKFSTLAIVVRLMRERLDWMDEDCEVRFEGRIDIGSSNAAPLPPNEDDVTGL